MIEREGYWWPDYCTEKDVRFGLNMVKYATVMLPYCKKKEYLIQAGGCIGLYPLEQAKHFKKVFTFEPYPDNYECLIKNTEGHPTIKSYETALGNGHPVRLKKSNYATHHVDPTGEIEPDVMTIDRFCDFMEIAPDALQLDVEGYEVEVLFGGIKTITSHRPVIQVEELSRDTGAVERFLKDLNYIRLKKYGKDRLYVPG